VLPDPVAPGPLPHPTGEPVFDFLVGGLIGLLSLGTLATIGGYLPVALRRGWVRSSWWRKW